MTLDAAAVRAEANAERFVRSLSDMPATERERLLLRQAYIIGWIDCFTGDNWQPMHEPYPKQTRWHSQR